MTLQKIFHLVRQGRWERCGRYYWICGICRISLTRAAGRERDRLAVLHCWAHARSAAAASFGG